MILDCCLNVYIPEGWDSRFLVLKDVLEEEVDLVLGGGFFVCIWLGLIDMFDLYLKERGMN